MKKTLALMLVLVALSFVGCSKKVSVIDNVAPLPEGDTVYVYCGTCTPDNPDRTYSGSEVVEITFRDEKNATQVYYAYLRPEPNPSRAATFTFEAVYKPDNTYDTIEISSGVGIVIGTYENSAWLWNEATRQYEAFFVTD